MNVIKRGSKSPTVGKIQYFLIGLGFYPFLADDDFGPKTEDAVIAYQRARGLKDDGVIGNNTLGKMLAEGLALMPTPDTAPVGVYPPGFPARPSFTPLTGNVERANIFGTFRYVPEPTRDNPEGIRITDDWEDKNIVLVQIPQLVTLGLSKTGNVRLHRKVKDQTLALWKAWEIAGLLHHVKSWHGMFFARFVRGSRSSLSNHSFGSAFDINYTGNELGKVPAAVGTKNSVRELVALAHKFGFYWGGHFSRNDGMHFEVAIVYGPDIVAQKLEEVALAA